jgi:hypothetical protein
MMRKTQITIFNNSNDALLYDYLEKCYYRNDRFEEPKKWQPGVLYFISIPLVLALSKLIDEATIALRANSTLLIGVVFTSLFVGFILGKVCTALIYFFSDKHHNKLTLCQAGEIVESYHFVIKGIRIFQTQCYLLVFLYSLLLIFLVFILVSHTGLLLDIGLIFLMLVSIMCE